jgi:hypothetical protein
MRSHVIGRVALIVVGGLAGAATMSWTSGQTPPPRDLPNLKANEVKSPTPTLQPVTGTNALPKAVAPAPKLRAAVAFDRFRNLENVPEPTRQMVLSALTGMEWLHRYNQPNGMFFHGYLPALNQSMEGDHFLHQAMATFTLARAARFTGDERYLVRANQAVLTLLSGTTSEPATPGIRRPTQPSVVCNRLAAASYIVMAIHELPEPAVDMVAKAEELCAFIRQQQREDGSMSTADSSNEGAPADAEANQYPGLALYALALSQRGKIAAWKTEALKKAVGFYRKAFKQNPRPDFVPWMSAACVECYLATKDNPFAEFVFEMNDWLSGLQYEQSPDPRRPLWRGGFKSVANGKAETTPPGIEAALYAQSLADACRLLRQMTSPDLARYERYRATLIRALQFLETLQFTEANSLHIAASYRYMLVGGFHPTHVDGNLRIDQSAAGVSAFIQFLVSGADRTK